MSVNITVKGKFGGQCRSHPLLADPQEVKKAEEKERRKLRLLQVREESKKLAKKIRDEVNEEKKRELNKLEATKERELECWRQNVLQRKGEEYRTAIFQVGAAHEAARNENERQKNKQKFQQGSYKDFKKFMTAKESQPGKVQFSCQPYSACPLNLDNANKEFKSACVQTDEGGVKNKNGDSHKRKRDFSFSSTDSECGDDGLQQSSVSLSSSCDSTISLLTNNQATQTTFVPINNKCLIKTPAVHLDVEVGTDDSITITGPAEIKDQHTEYRRQYSSIIRVSPRKGQQEKENLCETSSIPPPLTTNAFCSEMAEKDMNITQSGLGKSENKLINKKAICKEKRFTIISELVKKQQKEDKNTILSHSKNQASVTTVTSHLSPKKQTRDPHIHPPFAVSVTQSPRKASATSKSSRTITTQPLTSLSTISKPNSALVNGSTSSSRVQFYDYNSKLAKEKNQDATTVSVQRQRDRSQPSAMQQAVLENEREKERQLDELKKCQITEERGQKALEREQIRRDCNELTEKLEVLSREYANQWPSNENQLHIFADKQLRKESKMNSAIEKLLQRPSVITCSEQKTPIEVELVNKSTRKTHNLDNALNVAALNSLLPADDISSDSCCSLLLGYVDDQSKLVKEDLQNNDTTNNQCKTKRLKNLLERLDELRSSLVEELKNESESKSERRKKEKAQCPSKAANIRHMIDSISAVRREHKEINEISDNDPNIKFFRQREKEIEAKEAILERKVKEFYELQKQKDVLQKSVGKLANRVISKDEGGIRLSSNDTVQDNKIINIDKEETDCTSIKNPLEIIITVNGDTKYFKIPQKSKKRILSKKSPNKVSTLVKSPQRLSTKNRLHIAKSKAQVVKSLKEQDELKRQFSYDSSSTSYKSLPSELPTKIDDLTKLITKKKVDQENKIAKGMSNKDQHIESEISLESLNNMPRFNPPPHINPLVAQYVQRLLGMSREAVQKLSVSSTDIETPASSIINTTGNISNREIIITDERFTTLHNFIEENKSFIRDIEESIKSQNNASLENSIRMLDDIWRQRLESENHEATNGEKMPEAKKKKSTSKIDNDKKPEQKSGFSTEEKGRCETFKVPQITKIQVTKKKPKEPKSIFEKDFSKSLSSQYSTDEKESRKSLKASKHPIETVDKGTNAKLSVDSSKTESDSQIARYAKLTENCTHRIAELTELINRVRQEKQRLLEVTLSSVSENGRQSTEYLELPEAKSSTRNEQDDLTRASTISEETTQNKQSLSSASVFEVPKLSLADKNKHIANSRDSGIAESRPITALDNRIDQEPVSQSSSESTAVQNAQIRKSKPPPTLKRFSPQLPEDDLAHELSTILEVDTPATSRINTVIGQSGDRENIFNNDSQRPIKFPTFEQYIKELDLDITRLGAEESTQLQQEFATLMDCLQQSRLSAEDSPKYSEFPSINTYIQQLADAAGSKVGETIEASLARLNISGIKHHNFTAMREYTGSHNTSKSLPPEEQLLDTGSLENVTDVQMHTPTDNDTDSIDIQAELKKRNIIKHSFRVTEAKKGQIFSSTSFGEAALHRKNLPLESGVEKLSTSTNTSSLFSSDLNRIAEQRPRKERRKSKDVNIQSSSTSSTNTSELAYSVLRAASLDHSSKEFGKAFNLRDFLTRELEKLANNSSSMTNSSTDESLRNQFLHSLLGSLTPRTNPASSKSGGQTLDRQKTSTPVPVNTSQARSTTSSHSSSSNQLFSGESRISSVHYQYPSADIVASDNAKADNNSN